jgi:CheY-like chemotaxis protein
MEKILILLDDDSTGNIINKKMLGKYFKDHSIVIFEDPIQALEYFKSMDVNALRSNDFTMFLDLNMPSLSGFEFLEELEYIQDDIREGDEDMDLKVYLLTSENSIFAKEKLKVFPVIKNYLIKPLTLENIQLIS